MANDKIDRMGTESTFRLLLEFSLPAVAGVLVQMLYNIIDAVYVGHAVGPDGLAATTVANPTMTAMAAVAMLVGVGGNALAAIKLGERKRAVAERVLGNSFVLLLGVSALMWAVGALALDPILRFSGADDAVMPHARAFMTVIIAGCPLQFLSFGMNNFIRTAGHPGRAFGSMVVGTASNVVLGYLFIVVADGGMGGAGLATVCSWAVSAAFVMQFFLKKGSPMPLRRAMLGVKWRVAGRVCILRMKRTLVQAMALGVGITTPLWLVVVLFPDAFAHLFGLPDQYLAATAWALVAYLLFIPLIPIQSIGSNYFDATGQALKATVLTLTRQILFLIPLLVFAPQVLPQHFPITPLQCVFLAPSLSDVASLLAVLVFLGFEFRRLRRLVAQEEGKGLSAVRVR